VGYDSGSITASVWDMETSGQRTSDDGIGKTTAQMQEIDTYLREGWDFIDEILNGTCDYWQISTGEYPRLQYHTGNSPAMPSGLGTAEQPYLIRDARDLGVVWSKPRAHYRLEADVDLSGITWSMAVVPWFDGTLDGNGHVISNVHIQGAGFLGLFGQLRGEAEISSLGLDAVDVIGTGDNVGGLVGSNAGSITTSYNTGLVTGNEEVGGLVGTNADGLITSSFWDKETSGQSSSSGGTGKTTAEMQTTSTFLDAGWDFVGETESGTEDIWWILEGQDYPRLWWEAEN
jgi:hypothetical protein